MYQTTAIVLCFSCVAHFSCNNAVEHSQVQIAALVRKFEF